VGGRIKIPNLHKALLVVGKLSNIISFQSMAMTLKYYLLVTLITLISCGKSKKAEIHQRDALEKRYIAPNWKLQLPADAQIQWFDSTKRYISIITFPSDSLTIKCELQHVVLGAEYNCSYNSQVEEIKRAADGGICQGDGSVEITYSAVVNSATKMVGLRGDGFYNARHFVVFDVLDCHRGEYLKLHFERVSSEHNKLIHQIIMSTELEIR
jgi:hypothetical protein